jgi:hypothetical protein
MINDSVCGVLRLLVLQHASQEACCDTDFSSQNDGLVADMLYTCLNNKQQKEKKSPVMRGFLGRISVHVRLILLACSAKKHYTYT